MELITSLPLISEACAGSPSSLGLVPTMGALHQGHLSLIRRARSENQTLVVTIFVNPTQFGPQEDLAGYPRDQERDLALLRQEGADLVFMPSPEEMFPPGFDTWVDVPAIAGLLEGARRPGHFRGVATVVTKILSLIRPDKAYFGQKDGQQAVIIRRLALDLNLGTEIIVSPTVRDDDGLALSSRNAYLTADQRKAAPVLYRALRAAQKLWQEGIVDGERLRDEVRGVLELEPLVEDIDYVSVADGETLAELDLVRGRAMVSATVKIGRPRLIDNIILG
jgi:pantoate--beta-alanine ligase